MSYKVASVFAPGLLPGHIHQILRHPQAHCCPHSVVQVVEMYVEAKWVLVLVGSDLDWDAAAVNLVDAEEKWELVLVEPDEHVAAVMALSIKLSRDALDM